MSEPKAKRRPLRCTVLGPVMVTGVLTALAVAAAVSIAMPLIAAPLIVAAGWVLAWLLLGLTAGYALSGSA
ncbi:MAG: hypothetical protein ACT4NY_29925 [Pseudonocardiales bacterium]